MVGPTIEPSEVGATGLLWLLLSYGYVLYYASNLISEGSEYLLLVPELAGLVGGVVLPLLGAVPDGAIILFSGLGEIEKAQETLSVGVGALAGSTVMLLTVPFALSIYGGRVDYDNSGVPNYLGHPKLSTHKPWSTQLSKTGVTVTENVQHAGIVMMVTTIPYFLIQVPAMFMHGPSEEVAEGEHWWALSGLVVCLAGLVVYMGIQLRASQHGENRDKRTAAVKKLLRQGQVSLSGAVAGQLRDAECKLAESAATEYQSMRDINHNYPPPSVRDYLREILHDAYLSYDRNRDGRLDRREVYVFFRDFHESISRDEMDLLFDKFDQNNDGWIGMDEFIGVAYQLIKAKENGEIDGHKGQESAESSRSSSYNARTTIAAEAFAEEEEEEIPEEFTDLSPDEQQAALKKRAFIMCSIGTALVVIFSDPMVGVLQEIAVRIGMPPFYVSFILAPLASNASELLASMYYASKKTRKTIAVSLSTLCGAASLNNTFCLSIFFFLIYWRGLAWQFTAETLSIVAVEVTLGCLVQRKSMSLGTGAFILSIFPLSLILVATLEALGFD